MRVVMAANWWYRRGGLGRVMFDEAGGLEARGWQVIPFAAAHPENEPTAWSRYFPAFTEMAQAGADMSLGAKALAAFRLVHDRGAARSFAGLLADVRPDIIHLHGPSRQLSASIVAVAMRSRVPVVVTMHDYAVICPQGRMFQGEALPCLPPNCVRGNVAHAIVNRCVKRSTAASAVAAIEHLVHRATGAYTRRVARFVAPSRFVARAVVRAGVSASRVALLPNGVEPGQAPRSLLSEGGQILYAGRLAAEKGLATLVEAARRLPRVPFVIAGDGPLGGWLRASAPSNVQLVGFRAPADLEPLRHDAVAIVSPSIWFENAPVTVLEGMRAARPIIATDIGGQGELLAGGGGVLVTPGDAGQLATSIQRLWDDRRMATELGLAGRRAVLDRYDLRRHLDGLVQIYAEAGSRNRGVACSPARS
jgi:glycosyltransferase involved in cell wall biosynthesis